MSQQQAQKRVREPDLEPDLEPEEGGLPPDAKRRPPHWQHWYYESKLRRPVSAAPVERPLHRQDAERGAAAAHAIASAPPPFCTVYVLMRLARGPPPQNFVWHEVAVQPRLAHVGATSRRLHRFVLQLPDSKTWPHPAPSLSPPDASWTPVCTMFCGMGAEERDRRLRVQVWIAPPHDVSSPRGVSAMRWYNAPSQQLLWVTMGDLRRTGQSPEHPQGFANLFGHPFAEWTEEVVQQAWPRGATALQRRWPCSETTIPFALYHGGGGKDREACQKLVREGVRASEGGMLGPGVYLGSFFKATRYAYFDRHSVRGETYIERGGRSCVLRCLVFARRVKKMEESTYVCRDSRAKAQNPHASEGSRWFSQAIQCLRDPEGHWGAVEGFDAARLRPTPLGRGKWMVRNEEWCVREDRVMVASVAEFAGSSMATDKWRPWDRASTIL